MLSSADFIKYVETQWGNFGNTVNDPLKKSWKQICDVFNEQIHNSSNLATKVLWKAVQAPTGSGKTLCMKVYAAMLSWYSISSHPGMMIVTRLRDSADDIAADINRLAREYNPSLSPYAKIAISYHSGNDVELDTLKDFPVLVVCHAAYTSALEKLGSGSTVQSTWDYFYPFHEGERKLIVIDEAINLVEEYSITRDNVEHLLFLSSELNKQFPVEIQGIENILAILKEIEASKDTKTTALVTKPLSDRYATQEDFIKALEAGEIGNDVTQETIQQYKATVIEEGRLQDSVNTLRFDLLKHALRKVKLDEKTVVRKDPLERKRLQQLAFKTLTAIDALYKSWFYYNKASRKHAFATSRLLVPDDIKGAVVLDATAGVNITYELFEQCMRMQPFLGTRNYQNVTVHYSIRHKVGKEFMLEHSEKVREQLMQELEGEFEGREEKPKVLIVTHKDVEPVLKGYAPDNFSFEAAHWNAVDGSNDWKDYDTVVIFGLPYRPKTHSMNLFQAFQGVQSTEFLNSQGNRPFKAHEDILDALEIHQILTDVIQAVNRIRCRRVIDKEGNCPKADVYILLPNDKESKTILQGIEKEMPNIQFQEWVYTNQKRVVKRGSFDDALISYFRNMPEGRKSNRNLTICDHRILTTLS